MVEDALNMKKVLCIDKQQNSEKVSVYPGKVKITFI